MSDEDYQHWSYLAVQVVYSFTISYNYMDVIKMLVVTMIFSSTYPNNDETLKIFCLFTC